jgi:hypothetical protein
VPTGIDSVGDILKRRRRLRRPVVPHDPRVKTLAKLLTSPQVKQFIESKYRGAVLPAF